MQQRRCLLQIFIPKDKTSSCVYSSHPGGQPVSGRLQCTDHQSLLRDLGLKSAPATRPNDSLQARIILDHNIMLNPASGVKIFRYTTMAAEDEYRQQMEKTTTNMFIRWLECIKIDFVASKALERIDKTELGQKILKRCWRTGKLLPQHDAIDKEIAKLKAKLASLNDANSI